MEISDSHTCNLLSLELLAEYYGVDYSDLEHYYNELESDDNFLEALNERIDASRQFYSKGLFQHKNIDSIDWFGNQRIVMYVVTRLLKPDICVETGVFYGGTTAFILNALNKNGVGKLISIDLPANELEAFAVVRHGNVGDSEILPKQLDQGFIVPDYLRDRWQLFREESLNTIESLGDTFTLFSHDSEHTRSYMRKELELAKSKMPTHATIIADDVDWSNGFMEFCVYNKLYPLFLTDNGKSGLKVRLGIVRLDHPNIGLEDVTG